MKKLFLLFIILLTFHVSHFTSSQTIDTSNFALAVDDNGFYSELVNRTTYQGVTAGSFRIPLAYDYTSIDTSLWQITVGENGFYSYAVNRDVFYGKDTATVRLRLTYPTGNSTGTATTSTGTTTLNKLHGVVTTDNLTGNNDATITINNSFVKSTSIITLGIQSNPADVGGGQYPTYAITGVSDGSFEIKFAMATTFNGEANIHFTITNP